MDKYFPGVSFNPADIVKTWSSPSKWRWFGDGDIPGGGWRNPFANIGLPAAAYDTTLGGARAALDGAKATVENPVTQAFFEGFSPEVNPGMRFLDKMFDKEYGITGATRDAFKDMAAALNSGDESGGQRTSKPPDGPNMSDAAAKTMSDYGKKLLELLRDPKYAPMIAAPLLGLGAYGIYDSFRNKKRGKRPKFYDENAREF
jgi:hypothetical protein